MTALAKPLVFDKCRKANPLGLDGVEYRLGKGLIGFFPAFCDRVCNCTETDPDWERLSESRCGNVEDAIAACEAHWQAYAAKLLDEVFDRDAVIRHFARGESSAVIFR